ncbi:helix-turn-helix domain-containing protein [Staphylococcus epidermidis]|uniref:helix-turn-helix domain-containing protein n=1 Tax=Staphylococcus epidermidis TaxID=1282 RepID=UPI00138AF1A7|nr:helix-turn-helix domain-containing protein [Staphylococcus epidermidis]MBC2972573.1 helix-turn-helix domain-containing protein [Staphylococcus epidermidis]MBC2974488.1 helix-turn-helix domain-containing protein [Staphylococcus epidermidis]MBC3011057.1 helix-turn-helix domain-containing protein [Staphylococcus epidermidis]MBM6024056.1 helix-turn-helix domain-containing protein [Staphylococcus epidermidis]MCG1497989.1 helix-turn-helix domain containing protein [Staphylococcus epidermidis]
MPHVKLQDLPSKENVVTEPTQVVVKPIMAKPNAIAKLFGISYSSVYRILKEYEKDNKGIDDLYYSLSSTMTVISIPRFEEYMKKRHKDWM